MTRSRRQQFEGPDAEGVWIDEAAQVDAPAPSGRIKLADYHEVLETARINRDVAERDLAELPAGDPRRVRFVLRVETARKWVRFLDDEVRRRSRRRAP